MFNILDGITRLANHNTVAHHIIQVDKDIIAQKIIDFLFADAVTSHQLADGGDLVIGIMIDMHGGVFEPQLVNPINELNEYLFLFFGIMGPEFFELLRAALIEICITPEIFESALYVGITFDIKKHIIRAMRRQDSKAPLGARFMWEDNICLLYTSPSPRDRQKSRMPSSA